MVMFLAPNPFPFSMPKIIPAWAAFLDNSEWYYGAIKQKKIESGIHCLLQNKLCIHKIWYINYRGS